MLLHADKYNYEYLSAEENLYNFPLGDYYRFENESPEIVTAIKDKDMDFIDKYLESENDINSCDCWYNTTYLKISAQKGSLDCLKWLIY